MWSRVSIALVWALDADADRRPAASLALDWGGCGSCSGAPERRPRPAPRRSGLRKGRLRCDLRPCLTSSHVAVATGHTWQHSGPAGARPAASTVDSAATAGGGRTAASQSPGPQPAAPRTRPPLPADAPFVSRTPPPSAGAWALRAADTPWPGPRAPPSATPARPETPETHGPLCVPRPDPRPGSWAALWAGALFAGFVRGANGRRGPGSPSSRGRGAGPDPLAGHFHEKGGAEAPLLAFTACLNCIDIKSRAMRAAGVRAEVPTGSGFRGVLARGARTLGRLRRVVGRAGALRSADCGVPVRPRLGGAHTSRLSAAASGAPGASLRAFLEPGRPGTAETDSGGRPPRGCEGRRDRSDWAARAPSRLPLPAVPRPLPTQERAPNEWASEKALELFVEKDWGTQRGRLPGSPRPGPERNYQSRRELPLPPAAPGLPPPRLPALRLPGAPRTPLPWAERGSGTLKR
ncbi:hypothetical protein P7K49_010079 [Saguinus oedipus]|uniref:Uncharacterized protein n=1 Tax=Saguinus oedipus TaxID=9490 RepID=A0ABQ9VP49_SAGOE|nr:hypothetical protein P7K49_010079 [Saguinus oedipus]